MTLHKKKKIKRWSVRILLLLILLPLLTMVTVRYAGWFRMRKTDREIRAFLGPYHVTDSIATVKINGRDIVYLMTTQGEHKESALIMVHGSPGSLDAFLGFMVDTSLLKRADLVAYDRPGFGNSEFGRSEPSLAGQADVLDDLMDSLGYQTYWLAGHSYGASVLLRTAIRNPRRIAGICMIAGSVSPELEPQSVSWRKWIDLPLVRDLLPVSMRVSNEELMSLRQDLRMIEDDWDRLRIPVLIIHGKKDVLVPFDNLGYAREQLTEADTVFTKVFEEESHFILWTHQKDIIDEMVRWMDFKK